MSVGVIAGGSVNLGATTTIAARPAVTYAQPSYGFGQQFGGLSLPIGAGSFVAPPAQFVGGSVSVPSTPLATYQPGAFTQGIGQPFMGYQVGAAGLPAVPTLGHTYQSATYANPAQVVHSAPYAAPMSPVNASPLSPTSTYTVSRSNAFSGYTSSPLMPASYYNLGSSTYGSNVISAAYPQYGTTSYAQPTYSTAAPVTYSTSAPVGSA